MRAHSRRVWLSAVALCLMLPASLSAQRRPGVGMGFYTYTGLLSGEVEGGSVVASTSLIEAPWVALSAVGTVPLLRKPKKAWIAAVRVTPLNLGNRGSCYVTPESSGCQDSSCRFPAFTGATISQPFALTRHVRIKVAST